MVMIGLPLAVNPAPDTHRNCCVEHFNTFNSLIFNLSFTKRILLCQTRPLFLSHCSTKIFFPPSVVHKVHQTEIARYFPEKFPPPRFTNERCHHRKNGNGIVEIKEE